MGSFTGRSECLRNEKKGTLEDAAREFGSDESDDVIFSGFGRDRELAGDREELAYLLVVYGHKRW